MPSLRDFRRLCHSAAGSTGRRVTRFIEAAELNVSFHQCVITDRTHEVTILCDRSLPLLALARTPASFPLTFVDDPALFGALGDVPGFEVFSRERLATPFSQVDVSAFKQVTAADVRYWRPETLGDALFNHWD